MQYEVEINGRRRQVTVRRADGRFVVSVDGREWKVDAARVDRQTWSLLVEQQPRLTESTFRPRATSHEVAVVPDPGSGQLAVRVGSVPLTVSLNGRRRWGRKEEGGHTGSGPQRIVAPMPGKIVRVLVRRGDAVTARQPVAVIEAMKMENELRAGRDGIVKELDVQDGQSVEAGALLAVIA